MNDQKLKRALKYIDSWLDLRYRKNEWPGFTVAISHKGKILFNKSYGYSNIETKEKLTPNHIFRIASQSKTFTATAIMQLIEKEKIKITDPISKYLPWLSKHKDKRFKKVTIRQLLSHSAGIIRDGLDSDFWILKRSFPTEEQFIKDVLKADLIFNSGKKMKYSNIGFTLLGLLIEKASGISYNEYVLENIIKPLGLKNTGPEYTDSINDRLVTGYSMRGGDKKRVPFDKNINTKTMSPATGFYSTSEDLLQYFSAQMIESGKLLSDESKKEMQKGEYKISGSENKKKYGYGFVIISLGKNIVFGHLGCFPGQYTGTICDPKNNLIITVLTNCIDGNADYFANGIFGVIDYFEKNYSETSKLNLDRFEERLMSIWSIADIVSMGAHLVSVYPDLSNPFQEIEKLKYVKNNTLKITKTNGFYSEGELVHYAFEKDGKVKSVVYAGSTMPPEKKYLKNVKS